MNININILILSHFAQAGSQAFRCPVRFVLKLARAQGLTRSPMAPGHRAGRGLLMRLQTRIVFLPVLSAYGDLAISQDIGSIL